MRSVLGAGRARWVVLFAALLMVVMSVPVLAAEFESPEKPSPTPNELGMLPSGADVREGLEAVEREEEARELELSSPRAQLEREESRFAFIGLDALESQDLLFAYFATELASVNADPARFLSDAQLVQSYETGVATVKDDGKGMVLDTSIPLRAEDQDGDLGKVDLTLESDSDSFEPRNPLAAVDIPRSAENPIAIGTQGLALDPPVASESLGHLFGDKNVFYPEVLEDTDRLVAPIGGGVKTFDLLRSAHSPEVLRYEVELPEGATLRGDGTGGAEILQGDSAIAQVPFPTAVDAQGKQVPVKMEVQGNSLILGIPHQNADFAYPILLDPSVLQDWYYWSWSGGYGLDHLTNGSWVWGQGANTPWVHADTYCFRACWGDSDRGLFVSTNNGTLSANSEGFGHWGYTAPTNDSYIAKAWIAPFHRYNESCSKNDYPQPHDYAGLWSGSGWNVLHTNDANDQGHTELEGNWGKSVLIGMGTTGQTVQIPCWRNIVASGVAIWLDDWQNPTLDPLGGVPSSSEWISDEDQFTITTTSHDPGLGVQNVLLTPAGRPPIYYTPEQNQCYGAKGSLCPLNRTAPFTLNGDSFDQGETSAQVSVYDPTKKYSNTRTFNVKIDRSKPEVTLSGQLAEATGEVGKFNEEEDPGGWNKLRVPVYELDITAVDGDAKEAKTRRSGVKDIKVFLDDDEMTEGRSWKPNTSCPATSCKLEGTYTLALTKIDSAGKHELKVEAEDFAGKVRERNIEFEYFPATGMKDEYVMHRFPLPNGQGDEDEEENPVRPELAVNVVNGNLVYRERDIDVEGTAAVDLEVERFYNSQLPEAESTEWGDGWTLAQTPDLEPIDTGGSPAPDEAELVDQSGALREGVELPSEAGASKFDSAIRATVTKRDNGGFEMTDETGESATSVVFDETGQAEARVTEGYAKVDYRYEGGDLAEIEVTDPATFAADPEELQIPGPELISAPKYNASFGKNGSGDGQFKYPTDVAIDPQGNLWVTDKTNNRIQKFDPSGKFIAKYGSSGAGDGQFNRPSSVAIDSAGNVLVADSNNHRIQKLSPEGAFISKFGKSGSGNGELNKPEEVTVDAAGNIWVADTQNGRVQKFNEKGEFVKVFDSGYLYEPTGVDVDAGGNVWVADWQKNRITVFDSEGNFKSNVGTVGQFNRLDGLEIDNFGNVWVADLGNNRIQRLDLAGQLQGQFGTAGSGAGQFGLDFPMGIAADSKGHLWITDPYNDRVQEWLVPVDKPTYTASFGKNGSGDGQFKYPTDVAIDLQGNLWVTDKTNNRIQKFDSTGKFIAKYGSSGSGDGQFNRPSSVAVDQDGNILVADSNNHRIQKLNTSGAFISKFGTSGSGDGQLNKPEEVVTDLEGNIWVADVLNGRVQKFDESGQFLKVVDSGQLYEPTGIAIDAGGNAWIADRQKNRISVFDSEGTFKSNVGSAGSGNGQFNKPDAIEIDHKGNVWVADTFNNRIQRFDLAGQYQGQFGTAGSGAGQFGLDFPSGIATDREGHLWATDPYNDRVQKWLTANYIPAEAPELDLTDGDPEVEVETPGGLVSSVSGNAAGEHDYEHEGGLLVSHAGPEGETEYEYDEGRLSKVTLVNNTWAEIKYESFGRVESVTISIEGGTAKTTYFEYKDEEEEGVARRTTVDPPDAPHVTYDIGEDGSVFKWWNTESPPELTLSGSLWTEKEKETISTGAYDLEATAHSYEGIASIEIVTNGSTLVAEKTCEQDLEIMGIECVEPPIKKEWVTETGDHPPGRLQIEVIATDHNEKSASKQFWVNIPYTPPPSPDADAPPRFKDVLKFHEDYGLEIVLPAVDEFELNDRIFNAIGAWHNPQTPLGEVARASAVRWGVPLLPPEVAEMEYREWYVAVNGPLIDEWGDSERPNSYAGYYVDHRNGGVIRIGFTSDQASNLAAFQLQVNAPAKDRMAVFPDVPSASLSELAEKEQAVSSLLGSHEELAQQISELWIDYQGNAVKVGTSNTGTTSQIIQQQLGTLENLSTFYQPVEAELTSGRNRTSGRMLAGDRLVIKESNSSCTVGYGAFEKRQKKSDPSTTFIAPFALTAGHCFARDIVTWRSPYAGFGGKNDWSKVGQVTRSPYEFETAARDIEAIRLESSGVAPRQIYGRDGARPKFEDATVIERGQNLGFSGATTGGVRYGNVVGIRKVKFKGESHAVGVVVIDAPNEGGDSGGPVWDARTHAAVGLVKGRLGKVTYVQPLLNTPNNHGDVYPGALLAQQLFDLHLMTGD